jgi:hypothetical protein
MVHVKQDITKNNGWLAVGLISLLAIGLFPYGWLANNWPLFDQVTSLLFGLEAAHVVAHAGLFAGLGTAVLLIFPRVRQYPGMYFGIMIVVGMVQEFLQLTTFKHRPAGFGELFDLLVDLLAAGLVFVLWHRKSAATREKAQ